MTLDVYKMKCSGFIFFLFALVWFGIGVIIGVGPVVLQVLEVLQLVRCYSCCCWSVGPVVIQVLEVLQLVRCYSCCCWSDVIVVAVGQLMEL